MRIDLENMRIKCIFVRFILLVEEGRDDLQLEKTVKKNCIGPTRTVVTHCKQMCNTMCF